MKAVLLDADTLGNWQGSSTDAGFVDLSPLTELFDEFKIYSLTLPEERLERCIDADVIITNKVILDRDLLSKLPKLKAIQLTATGMNNVDLGACKALNVKCLNVANYSTYSVAQLTLSFILNAANRTLEHHLLTKSGAWQESPIFTLTNYPTSELLGKKLLIIGYGNIGQKVEQLASAFGMEVMIANIPGRPLRENQVPLLEALPDADFVSLHCPLSDETHQLVNNDFFQKMKPTGYLINTARGPIINEHDLAKALQNNIISGAALDVLTHEPPEKDNPLLTSNLSNLIVTPHIAWASQEAKQKLVAIIAKQLKDI